MHKIETCIHSEIRVWPEGSLENPPSSTESDNSNLPFVTVIYEGTSRQMKSHKGTDGTDGAECTEDAASLKRHGKSLRLYGSNLLAS